ncbi:MAG: hypothetical protein ACKPKO_07495, partial [Candidatus Fonsibacter sp.]
MALVDDDKLETRHRVLFSVCHWFQRVLSVLALKSGKAASMSCLGEGCFCMQTDQPATVLPAEPYQTLL